MQIPFNVEWVIGGRGQFDNVECGGNRVPRLQLNLPSIQISFYVEWVIGGLGQFDNGKCNCHKKGRPQIRPSFNMHKHYIIFTLTSLDDNLSVHNPIIFQDHLNQIGSCRIIDNIDPCILRCLSVGAVNQAAVH